MIVAEETLADRARSAYEAGRLRWALMRTVAALAIAAVALLGCPAPGGPAVCAAALGAFLATCLWRGGSWARGARLGFLAGLAPCLLPATVRALHVSCASLCPHLPSVCLAAGVAAGLLVAWRGLRVHADRRFWLAAAGAAVLAGAVGCLTAGLAGLGGMALGLLAGAAGPVLVARAA
ncbi:MAG TPA: hypothetical protein VOA87_06350 [Thermoanaerobaculia bacterium]|nr:hypothetical protein [Thermoanaerobaculia bacterium]